MAVVDAYWAAPPIARTVATTVFACSVAVYTGMISSGPFWFHYSHLWQLPPALHRLVLPFFLTGPNLGVLFDTYFVFSYLSTLEKSNSKFSRKEDLIWYLMVVGSVIIILNQVFTGITFAYLTGLLIAMCYTATQDQRGQTAHFYVVTIPAQLMPACLLLVTLLTAGMSHFLIGVTGLVAAHFHDFCTRIYPEFGNGPNLLPTPWFISWIMTTPRIQNTVYGSTYVPPKDKQPRSGPLPDSWRSAGPGRRLG
ncbi:hypothetical protein JX265_011817 [Neoarthrinium moseri]|uniref:Derlin n=1 Tax=Neoarthrinium moseri TaxID=1658444 RepID=A0A9P9WBS5_9PEZI|nr:hypothetical protein JX265_011817 [Neoarthrinium moseri]